MVAEINRFGKLAEGYTAGKDENQPTLALQLADY